MDKVSSLEAPSRDDVTLVGKAGERERENKKGGDYHIPLQFDPVSLAWKLGFTHSALLLFGHTIVASM